MNDRVSVFVVLPWSWLSRWLTGASAAAAKEKAAAAAEMERMDAQLEQEEATAHVQKLAATAEVMKRRVAATKRSLDTEHEVSPSTLHI